MADRQEKRRHFTVWRCTFCIFVVMLAVVLVHFFVFRKMQFFMVPSESMLPTLQVVDHVMTLEEESYRRGDVVVLHDPVEQGAYLVKRVVATAGDLVRAVEGGLIVNGEPVDEPYLKEPMGYSIALPIQVPEGEVFVLGDNRNESDDCHVWYGKLRDGIPEEEILGKAMFIYLPPSRMGRIQ